MSTLGVKTFMSCSYVHEIRNHVHIMGLQNRCKKQLFLWKIGGLRTLASQPEFIANSIRKVNREVPKPERSNPQPQKHDFYIYKIQLEKLIRKSNQQ